MKKKVYYSYLLNREKDLKWAIQLKNEAVGLQAYLHKSVLSAAKARYFDCYDGANAPGPIVKITLEALDETTTN